MDYKHEAKRILYRHSDGVMSCAKMEFDSNEEMLQFMTEECAFILTDDLIEGKYTPMQFNAIRNELAEMLWTIFAPHIAEEQKTKK